MTDEAMNDRRPPIREWVAAFTALAMATVVMLLIRSRLDKAHVALIYLLVVLGGSGAAGRVIGLSLGVSAFLLFNLLFLPPYYTLAVTDPLDWLVLVVFLITSVVAAELLDRQRRQAALAAARAREIDRLSTLGAETLNAARADQALSAIADVIRQAVGVERCELFVWERSALRRVASSEARAAVESTELLEYVARTRRSAIELEDDTIHVVDDAVPADDAPGGRRGKAFAIALTARGETVGALRVSGRSGFVLTRDQWRVLTALAYYAALATYRLRLEQAEEAAESLRRADRLKDSLLAAVSHDLRTPLTTIKGIAQEIAQRGEPQALVIGEETDRLAALVDDLLQMSQLDAGGLRVALEINTVDDLIGAALQRAEKVLRDHPVDARVADAFLAGRFDFSHALRILVNLLENAAKYSRDGASIDIRAERSGDEIAITVLDRGRGIPPSERERIFEPFYRSPEAPPDVRGAGLGLSIARRLAAAQHGSLTVRERIGGGSEFTLTLPAADIHSS
jgi:two-component system sensor histidine kinase KdpD